MTSFADSLFTQKCMSSPEADQIEVAEDQVVDGEKEGSAEEMERIAREATEASEENPGHRNLLMRMGMGSTSPLAGCGDDLGDSELSETDDFSQEVSSGTLSCRGPCRDLGLESNSDNGAGVWEWLCCTESEDCSIADSDHEENENQDAAVPLSRCCAPGACWTACGCCRRGVAGVDAEEELAKSEDERFHVCDLQAAEISSASTRATSAQDELRPELSNFASGDAAGPIVMPMAPTAPSPEAAAATISTVVSLDDYFLTRPKTVTSI